MAKGGTVNTNTSAPVAHTEEITADGVHTAEELAATSGLDLSEFRIVHHKVKTWGVQQAGGRTAELGSTVVRLERLPSWYLNPIKLPHWKRKKPKRIPDSEVDTVLLIPDSQNGYLRGDDGTLIPMHDRRAWDLAVRAAKTIKPNMVVLLGDMLDLAPWSTRWPASPRTRDTTNPALAELYWWVRQIRFNAPAARIVYVEGNHEARIFKGMRDRLEEAESVRAPLDVHRALSLQKLLHLDSLSVEYVGPYGADFWLWKDSPHPVRITHGRTHGSGGGATVAKVLREADYSRVFGHVHRREMASRTVHGPQGHYERFALTPGCMCRLDDVVPAVAERMDWQQGLGVLRRVGDVVLPELIPIVEGTCTINGKVIEAGDRVPEIAQMFPRFRWA